jgi:hypothetical protein
MRACCLYFNMTGHLDGEGSGIILHSHLSLGRRVNREKEIIMSKFFQKTLVLSGSLALIALMSAVPVAPANAQGVPAGLLRLDSSQPSSNSFAEVERPHAKIRNAYARARKIQPHRYQ